MDSLISIGKFGVADQNTFFADRYKQVPAVDSL